MSGSQLVITAAAPSKNLLSIVTLSWNGSHLYLCPSKSGFFELQRDDQAGVRMFARELWEFTVDSDINGMLVKRGPAKGLHAAAPQSAKMETVLQLLPVPCVDIHVQSISGWRKRADWLLPQTQIGLRSRATALQQLAIETASFGIWKILENRNVVSKIQHFAHSLDHILCS